LYHKELQGSPALLSVNTWAGQRKHCFLPGPKPPLGLESQQPHQIWNIRVAEQHNSESTL